LWQNLFSNQATSRFLKTKGGNAMKKIMSLVVILSMLLAPMAFAASSWTEGKTYGEKVSGKLGYGLTNTILGWTKLISTPNDYSTQGKNVWQGVGQGVVDGAVTTVLGAVQLLTFPIPADIEIPSPVNLSGK